MYRFELEYQGDTIIKYPRVPENIMPNEDNITKRICVCETIPGCIMSLELQYYYAPYSKEAINFNIKGIPLELYLYKFNCENNNSSYFIKEPIKEEVSDAFYTGEKWIIPFKETDGIEFKYISKYYIRVHEHLPNSCYSRYAITREGYEEIIDAICEPIIYGDENAFSIILNNPFREQVAYNYIQEKGIGVDAYTNHGTNW